MANWTTEAAFDDGISTEATERFVLHDRAIDTPTLSPECQQPSHQSVENPPTRRHRPESGLHEHPMATRGSLMYQRFPAVWHSG